MRSLSTWDVSPPSGPSVSRPASRLSQPCCRPAGELLLGRVRTVGQLPEIYKRKKRLPLPPSRWHEALPAWGTSNLRIQWAFNTFLTWLSKPALLQILPCIYVDLYRVINSFLSTPTSWRTEKFVYLLSVTEVAGELTFGHLRLVWVISVS